MLRVAPRAASLPRLHTCTLPPSLRLDTSGEWDDTDCLMVSIRVIPFFRDGEIDRGPVSTPYSPPRYHRNSHLQLALAVRHDLEIIFQSATVSTKLCERHDAIQWLKFACCQANKNSMGLRKRTPSSRHQLSVRVCAAHAWHEASRHG